MSNLRGLSLFAHVGIAEAYMKDIGVELIKIEHIFIKMFTKIHIWFVET